MVFEQFRSLHGLGRAEKGSRVEQNPSLSFWTPWEANFTPFRTGSCFHFDNFQYLIQNTLAGFNELLSNPLL